MPIKVGFTKIHPAKIKKVIRLYQEEGLGAPEIVKRTHLAETTVYRLLDRAGIERSTETRSINRKGMRKFSDAQEKQVVREYQAGASLSFLGEKYNCCSITIINVLKRHDVPRRRKGNVVRSFTDEQVAEIKQLWTDGKSQQKIATKFEVSQSVISRVLRSNGLDSSRHPSGDNHWQWKGGVVHMGKYLGVLVPANDPLAVMRNTMGYVMEHRLVMARHLGRPLFKWESVHHLNGDTRDNRLENLQLRTGKHGNGVAAHCADCGSTNLIYETLH